MIRTVPFWLDRTPFPEDLGVTELPEHVDVAIVGAGYTGLHAALALAHSGSKVLVLEAHSIGWGASTRNAGMVSAGFKLGLRDLVRKYGRARAEEFADLSRRSVSHLEETIRSERIDCDFDRCGDLALATKPAHFERMRAGVRWLEAEFGQDHRRILSDRELRAEIGSTRFHGGILDPTAAALDPARYVLGLARAVARREGIIAEHANVTRLARAEGRFRLTTTRGSLRADEVLLATNGHTSDLVPGARRGIFPVGSYIITTDPLPPDLAQEIDPNRRTFFDSRRFLNYFRLTPDGRLLFGGRNDLSTTLDLDESARRLRARMIEVFPQLDGMPVSHSWSGKLGVTFDRMPHIGRVDGVHYAYGYAGHGVAMSGLLGREVGRMLSGESPRSLFAEIRHPRRSFARCERLFLPWVSMVYRFLDRID